MSSRRFRAPCHHHRDRSANAGSPPPRLQRETPRLRHRACDAKRRICATAPQRETPRHNCGDRNAK
ncbi:MAG TPA: hypothetical protein VFQ35_11715, partial [Polyangiaceae bacterium]|nr:hypothetical protein [Polyangiaceae bacterium]